MSGNSFTPGEILRAAKLNRLLAQAQALTTELSDVYSSIALKLDASEVSAFGLTLIDDADASEARTTLGLDAMAVEADAASDGARYVRRNSAWEAAAIQTDAASDSTPYVREDGAWVSLATALPAGTLARVLQFACGDETTAIAAPATDLITLRAPYAFTLSEVRASLNSACATGTFEVDVKKNGTTIFTTTLTIDATEKTSKTAATPAALSVTSIADDDEITVDVVDEGDGTATGLKVTLIGQAA